MPEQVMKTHVQGLFQPIEVIDMVACLALFVRDNHATTDPEKRQICERLVPCVVKLRAGSSPELQAHLDNMLEKIGMVVVTRTGTAFEKQETKTPPAENRNDLH